MDTARGVEHGGRRRRRWALLLAGLVGPVGGALGLPAGAGAEEATDADFPAFTSTPPSGSPGSAITASGAGCSGAQGGQVSLGRAGSHVPVATATIRVGPAGDWGSTLRVPAGAPAGEYVVGAMCTFERGTPNVYRENAFTVSAPAGDSIRRLGVAPSSVPLGGSTTVRGAGCRPPGTAIAAVTQNGSELEGAQVGHPNPSGEWSFRFVFKAGYVDPGATIAVTARCFEGAAVRFTYEDRVVDVLPAPSASRRSVEPGRGGGPGPAVAPPHDAGGPAPGAPSGAPGLAGAPAVSEGRDGSSVPWVLAVLAGAVVAAFTLRRLPGQRAAAVGEGSP
jgi:hypothetical protein